MNKKKLIILISIIIALAALACVGIFAISRGKASKIADKLDLGEKYLEELKYEKALAAYKEVLKIDPKSVDAYLGMAEVYIAMGEYEEALEILEEGYEETESRKLERKIEEVEALIAGTQATPAPTPEPTPEPTAEPAPEVTPEPTPESTEQDWLTNGIPRSNIKDLAGYTIDGVFFPCLSPQLLLDMYGEYDNTYEVDGRTIEEQGGYEVSDFVGGTYSYSMSKSDGTGYWHLYSEERSGWEEVFIRGRNWEIGFADIYFGDDFHTVMSKLGFTQEQADWVKAGITDGEETNTWGCYGGTIDMIIFPETQFCYSSGYGTYCIFIPVIDERYPFVDTIGFGFDSEFKLTSVEWARNVDADSISR